jgi:hypothetical protein
MGKKKPLIFHDARQPGEISQVILCGVHIVIARHQLLVAVQPGGNIQIPFAETEAAEVPDGVFGVYGGIPAADQFLVMVFDGGERAVRLGFAELDDAAMAEMRVGDEKYFAQGVVR